MDFTFEGFESSDFEAELEDVVVRRTRRFDRLWRIGEGGSICLSELHEGVLYFGAADSYFYAMDADSGKLLWRFRADGIIMGKPFVERGIVYFTCYDGRCYALDAGNGKMIWRFKTGGPIFEGPNGDDKIICFCSKDGFVYCLDRMTGKETWRFKTGDEIIFSPGVAEGRVFSGSFDSNFYCIDAKTGKELWRFRTGEIVLNDIPPLVRDGVVYFSSWDNNTYAVDIRSGKEFWRFKTGNYGNTDGPVYNKGILYQGSRDGILYALTMEGKEIWRYKTGGLLTQVTIANDRLYFSSEDGYVRCISTDGKDIWKTKSDNIIWDIPKYHGGKIIFGTWDCHVFALDAGTGEEIWRFTTGGAPSYLPPANEFFEVEIRKGAHIEDAISEEKYKKKGSETISLSDYHVSSEYATTSEYKQKSDYDTHSVIFEITAGENRNFLELKFEPMTARKF